MDEKINSNLDVYNNVMMLAKIKCEDVYSNNRDRLVLAADTIVVYNDEILGKPKDEEDAFRMLKLLSGKTHEVITGVCLMYHDKILVDHVISKVTFKNITDDDIKDYIKTKEPMDKAGSYAIQGIGSKFVENYSGDYNNIVGLPMEKVLELLNEIKK